METDPKAALASIKSARESLAVPVDYPIWYDLLYGAVCGLLVAGQGLPTPWSLLILAPALGGLAFMVSSWTKRYGVWVNGYSPKRARWVAIGLVIVLFALMGLSLYGRFVGPDWLYLVSGAIGFVAAIAGGRLWAKVWRKDLSEEVQ